MPAAYPRPTPPAVLCDPAIMGGVPCFAGTRVPVDIVLGSLAKGMTLEEVRTHYEFLTPAHVDAAMTYRAQSSQDEMAARHSQETPLTRFATVLGASAATSLVCATRFPNGPLVWPLLTALVTAALMGLFMRWSERR